MFFAGEAFKSNVRFSKQLAEVAADHGVSLAAFVLALNVRAPESDISLVGCRTARELIDGLAGLNLDIDSSMLDQIEMLAGKLERPTENLLGESA